MHDLFYATRLVTGYSDAGRVLLSTSAALLLSVFLAPRFIAFLREKSLGQNIREEGPEGHKQKAGTPTMGGIIIIVAFAVPYLCLSTHDWKSLGVFFTTLACGLLGFADDYTKIIKRRSLGLRARMKLLSTVVISVGLWWVATQKAGISSSVSLRPLHAHIDMGPFFPLFIYLVVAATTSAVNLTDGLDGLAAGCVAITMLVYVGIAFITHPAHGNDHDLELIAGTICGACIGFLWYNSFPASIFMGDTGSLALGGAISGLAIMTDTGPLLIVIGGIFVIEALSVVIQVLSYKILHRRVFKMAPIHHHFELEAWSETKIILRFWIVAAAFGAIGFTLYQLGVAHPVH